MKKNVMMRLASFLLVAVLITTSAISGTYAKYVTTGSASDSARVAKWGIELSVTGDGVFEKEYKDPSGNTVTVLSGNTDKLVAPGTKDDEGITFTIKGTPEVAFKLTASLGENYKDVYLKEGTYDDYTQAPATKDGFTLPNDYYPVVFTLVHTYGENAFSIKPAADAANVTCENNTANRTDTITGTLADINDVLIKLSSTMTKVNPNYPLDDTFKLTWAWDFDANGAGTNDKADTLLGNLAAQTVTLATEKYNLNVSYAFSITVTQID